MKRSNKNILNALFKIDLTQTVFVTFDTLDTNLLRKYKIMIVFEKHEGNYVTCSVIFIFLILETLYLPPYKKSSICDVKCHQLPIK